jgi:dienelactone hydrolase
MLWPALVALLAAPASPFEYDAKAPLDLREGSVETVDGVGVGDVSYASPRGGRVPGYLVAPPGKGPFAGIVFMHWGQGNRTEFLSEALVYAKEGAVSLMIDAPSLRPEAADYKWIEEAEKERDEYAHLVVDLRRAVDVLLARKDVDPRRIGYVGHSLGATWGGPLAGVEKRIRAFVLMGGLPTLADVFGESDFAKRVQSRFSREQLERYAAVMAEMAPKDFVGRAEPGSILFQFARRDRYITEKAARDYAAAAGPSHTVRWYFTSHEFNDEASARDRHAWLAKCLSLSARGAGSPNRR